MARSILLGIGIACGISCAQPALVPQHTEQHLPYQQGGPMMTTVLAGDIDGAFGCQVSYEQYHPATTDYRAQVILSHGFLRNLKHMRGWAEHWASWGVPTTVVSLCNSNLLNGHHPRNATDLIRLAQRLYPEQPVIIGGYSAGGLAAWLAAADYSHAVAYLGLDPVDSGKLAQRGNTRPSLPGLVLYARPSLCNARNNFLKTAQQQPLFALEKIAGASHCHFENPYDRRCAWLCGDAAQHYTNAGIEQALKTRTTQWLLGLAVRAR